MNFNYLTALILFLLFAILIFQTYLFKDNQRRKKKRRERDLYGENTNYKNVNNASSKANFQTIQEFKRKCDHDIQKIHDRLDKLEIDTTFLKDFNVKKDFKSEDKNFAEVLPTENISSELVDLLKSKSTTLFSNAELDEEIRNYVCKNIFKNKDILKKNRDKAYKRLYSRTKYKK
jgi:hypothetical protein